MIKISLGFNIFEGHPVIRADYYKSQEAFLTPEKYPNDCYTCSSPIDLFDQPNNLKHVDMVKHLIKKIENTVNMCLDVGKDK